MFKRKQEKKSHLAKMSSGMRANIVVYIWKKLLIAAVELPNIMECRW